MASRTKPLKRLLSNKTKQQRKAPAQRPVGTQEHDHVLPACSKRTHELVEFMRGGKVPARLPFPETALPVTTGWGVGLQPVPNNVPRGVVRHRSRDIRVTTGSAGTGILIVQPQWAGISDFNAMWVSGATYATGTFPASGAVGLTLSAVDPLSPYSSAQDPFVWCGHLSVTMKANSAALTAKQGRVYMGLNYESVQTGDSTATIEGLQTFQTWAIDQVNQANMPTVKWVPMTHAMRADTPVTASTVNFPSLIVWIDGADTTTNTIFEFTLSYTSVIMSEQVPWDRELEVNTDAIMAAQSSMVATARKGFSHPVGHEPAVSKKHHEQAAVHEVTKQPLMTRLVNFGKDLISRSPVASIIRKGIGLATSLFGKT